MVDSSRGWDFRGKSGGKQCLLYISCLLFIPICTGIAPRIYILDLYNLLKGYFLKEMKIFILIVNSAEFTLNNNYKY